MPAPLLTFEGLSGDPENTVPDSDGDVGPNHYVQSVNRSIMIFDKNGNYLSGPTSYDSFFAGLTGTPCSFNNIGDPFTLYDPIADRWLISDLAFEEFPGTSFWECIGVANTPNPVSGGWTLYAFTGGSCQPNLPRRLPKVRDVELWREPSAKCLFPHGQPVSE